MRHSVIIPALVLLAQCTVALAQSADYATFSEESRRAIVLTLALDEEQIETLDDLIDGYDVDAEAIIAAFRRGTQEIDERDPENTRRFALIKRLEIERDRSLIKNRERLFDDLALVLDDDQSQRVGIARTRLRRAPMFEELSGDASGFTADPVRVADKLALFEILSDEEFEAFDGAMITYDNIIAPRLAKFLSIRAEFAENVESDGAEGRQDAVDEYVESMIEAIIDLRTTHASRLKSIGSSLPSPLDERWRETALRLSHPRVFVDSWGERTIAALLVNDDLLENERERLRGLEERFAPRYERARVRIAEAIEQAEERVTLEQAKRSSFITRNAPEVIEARESLSAIDAELRRRVLRAIDPALRGLVPPVSGSL